jgi:hypothetical protein
VIAAGIPAEWLAPREQVEVRHLPTYYGPLSYSLCCEDPETYRLTLTGDLELPPGGILAMPPLSHPLLEVRINGRYRAAFTSDGARCSECPAELELRC